MDTQETKRLKSFMWRAAMMGIAAALAYVVENITVLEMSPTATTILGLVLGELSKYVRETSKTI